VRGFPKLSRRAEAGRQNKIFIEAVILKFGLVISFNISLFLFFFNLAGNGSLCKNPVLKIYFVKNTILRLFAER